ncbi:MAG: NYN domain-containing protein [Verrucomicrobia bacterium]|nr:NYN domain-containing protein [Verrucomicrobiota bacterium]
MASERNNTSILAVFCDFENVAIGAREAKFARFEIAKVLERLLVKGNIVVKKAYCDWSRYETYKRSMHEAAFELIDIPHFRQSGKNSADIRMVVDALDLCYTKPHVDTFVIISGDSDFSPLVSKLRENNKLVIGLGVRHSTSDLFVSNCDEFIFYDDLVRKVENRAKPSPKRASSGAASPDNPQPDRRDEAIDLVAETLDTLLEERGEETVIWASMVKQTIKRQRPGFIERDYGFRSFSDVLKEAQKRGMLRLEEDEKSGSYVVRRGAPDASGHA